MPSNNTPRQPRWNVLRNLADRVQQNTDSLYKSTYYSDNTNKRQLQSIQNDINSSIKDIMDSNADNIGEPNISKLYERIFMSQNDPENMQAFEQIFSDNEFISNLTSSYMDNRWVRELDTETDEVLKYMPKLQEALDTIRDNVLSADSFSKDFLNIENHIDTDNSPEAEQFSRNIDDMKERYDLLTFTTDVYDETSKYGESFIYCVPYDKAIQRLMDRKGMYDKMGVKANYAEGYVVIESADSSFEPITLHGSPDDINGLNYTVQIERGIISSVVETELNARKKKQSLREQCTSLTESYFDDRSSVIKETPASMPGGLDITNVSRSYAMDRITDYDLQMGEKLPVHHHFDHTLDDELEIPDDNDSSNDGLYQTNTKKNTIKEMNGCIVKMLKRDRITPIILNDICLGYYYFEFDPINEVFDERGTTTGTVNTITGLRSNGRAEEFDAASHREDLLRSISSQLADKIDPDFVNANQDLKKEIYYILKYNDDFNSSAITNTNIRVSYIPPEDVHHLYFKLDEDTSRGVSDLEMSMIPAKLWVAIYITNCLAIMTRGNDHRVYYVKQSVESNISKTLLKTIDEIKKNNFGIRQIENINSVLNIVGRFNDYIIPRGQDGQSPIEFEIMQGQNVEIKTDLLNLLEESAINVTGVPIEIIQNRQSPDYALQLTMSNSKFLRFVYARQAKFQNLLKPLFTKIYDIEYGSTVNIDVTLPPPLYINLINTNQLLNNAKDFCQNITDIRLADEQDDSVKQKFLKNMTLYYIGGYVNEDIIERMYNKAKQEATLDYVSNPENMEGSGGGNEEG